jgi:hypothetical protein
MRLLERRHVSLNCKCRSRPQLRPPTRRQRPTTSTAVNPVDVTRSHNRQLPRIIGAKLLVVQVRSHNSAQRQSDQWDTTPAALSRLLWRIVTEPMTPDSELTGMRSPPHFSSGKLERHKARRVGEAAIPFREHARLSLSNPILQAFTASHQDATCRR